MTALQALDRTIRLCRDYVADELSGEEICKSLQSTQILCISDTANLSSHSGQVTLVTLVSLLSRMGMQVAVRIPETTLLSSQPPASGQDLRTALVGLSESLVPDAKVYYDLNFAPDIVFALGDSELAYYRAPCWRLNGSAWLGTLAFEGVAPRMTWTVEWPVGAMVSAALAAGEAFKFAIRRLPLRNQSDRVFIEQSEYCQWDFGPVTVPRGGIDLGRLDVISAGAISQAALYVLIRLPGVRVACRIFDDDTTAISNLNRNMLTVLSDVGIKKVWVVADRCAGRLQLDPVDRRFPDGWSDNERLAPRVLIGVDDIPSRWEAQRRAPGWLAVSGTSHFAVSSSSHGPAQPCGGCLHPVDDPGGTDPIPTVSFVSFWAGLTMAVRLIREAIGTPYDPKHQHLWLSALRMDQRNGAMWLPVASRHDCPVGCLASRNS